MKILPEVLVLLILADLKEVPRHPSRLDTVRHAPETINLKTVTFQTLFYGECIEFFVLQGGSKIRKIPFPKFCIDMAVLKKNYYIKNQAQQSWITLQELAIF